MKKLLFVTAVLVAVSATAAGLIAMRVETEAVRGTADGTVVSITIQIAPEDRERAGDALWVSGQLFRGGDSSDRFDQRVEVKSDGVARVQRTWAPGSYELRVDIEGLRGGETGFWKGRVRVPTLQPPPPPQPEAPTPSEQVPDPPAAAAAAPVVTPETSPPAVVSTETPELDPPEVQTATAKPEPAAPLPPTPLPTPSAAPPAPPPAPVRSPDATGSTVTVLVTDSQNQPMHDLEKHQFELRVDRQTAPIVSFAGSESSLLLVLAVDTSRTTDEHLPEIRRTLSRLSQRVLGEGGRLQVIVCDETPQAVIEAASGDRALGVALGRSGEAEEGPLADLVTAAVKAAAPTEGRRVVVLVSDGGDSSSRSQWRGAYDAAAGGGVPILTVALDLGGLKAKTSGRLRKAAEASGGKHYLLNDIGVLELTLDHYAQLIDATYALGSDHFQPGEHRLDIDAGKGLVVQHSSLLRVP